MDELIACCGLDCSACQAREATLKDDNQLRQKVAAKWSELNGVLITADMINCVGCRAEGVKTPFCQSLCQIRLCALGKGFATCGDCQNMDGCKIVSAVHSTNEKAKTRLKNK
ncbi:MAG: DUF3795 domain-containing protein [Candidatus Coproplasma sp.]